MDLCTSELAQTSFSKSSISISEELHGVVRFQDSVSQLRMSPVRKVLKFSVIPVKVQSPPAARHLLHLQVGELPAEDLDVRDGAVHRHVLHSLVAVEAPVGEN